ncbi:hypothetical protein [Leuconostoc lactis]|uniref:Uncharacterized protein n=1 Tax=Leuconostoc lactis TaxID=1246 RepID=A0A6L7ABH1_LEULA|nr:hypothetical protein [Leuconostoc lactis]ANY11123.1 hypothetical protein BCR17_01290 [Leuconostoc lactis]MCT8387198.1 hypothetical protein [Leuconostoc lactis]MWN20863.1 hypothetical protein [Leuconostoc lactis]
MQRRPFKQSHKLRNTLIAIAIAAIALIVIFTLLGRSSGQSQDQQAASSSSQTKTAKKASSAPVASESSVIDDTTASTSTSVVPTPPAASSAASSVISAAKEEATGTPITAETPATAASSNPAVSSSAAPVAKTFGNWSLATYNAVNIGSATYEQIKATYGAPTYMTASDQLYATWQSTSGQRVSITFTPTGTDNIQLIATNKSESGLQ